MFESAINNIVVLFTSKVITSSKPLCLTKPSMIPLMGFVEVYRTALLDTDC